MSLRRLLVEVLLLICFKHVSPSSSSSSSSPVLPPLSLPSRPLSSNASSHMSLHVPSFLPLPYTSDMLSHVHDLIPRILDSMPSSVGEGRARHGMGGDYTVVSLTSTNQTGVLPSAGLTSAQLLRYFERGFSLIVNRLEMFSLPVLQLAEAVKGDRGAARVQGNLYVTPNLRHSQGGGSTCPSTRT